MLYIKSPVGNNKKNRKEDVLAVKAALSALGRFHEDEPHGYITRNMDMAIKVFQKDYGLRVDGKLNPDGETEQSIRVLLIKNGESNEEPKTMPSVPPGKI